MINYIAFKWSETTALPTELTKPLERISVQFDPHGKPVHVTLWRTDGTGLGLSSAMHDVAERREVGVLELDCVPLPSEHEAVFDVRSQFGHELTVSKLIIEESGTKAESGVNIKSARGDEIVIVAGAFPFSLAIRGLTSGPQLFEPEYPIELYKQVPIAQAFSV